MAKPKNLSGRTSADPTQPITSGTKTAMIRRLLKVTKSPSEVSAMMLKEGVKASAQYVSTIKASDKRRKASGAPHRKPGRPVGSGMTRKVSTAPSSNGTTATELLLLAIDLVAAAGPGEAKALVVAAEKVVDRINNR